MNVDQIMMLAKSEAALRIEVKRLTAERDALREESALWEERARHLGWRDEHEAARKT